MRRSGEEGCCSEKLVWGLASLQGPLGACATLNNSMPLLPSMGNVTRMRLSLLRSSTARPGVKRAESLSSVGAGFGVAVGAPGAWGSVAVGGTFGVAVFDCEGVAVVSAWGVATSTCASGTVGSVSTGGRLPSRVGSDVVSSSLDGSSSDGAPGLASGVVVTRLPLFSSPIGTSSRSCARPACASARCWR
jgi:hypothetical protein